MNPLTDRADPPVLAAILALRDQWHKRADWAASDACPLDFYPQDAFGECHAELDALLPALRAALARPPSESDRQVLVLALGYFCNTGAAPLRRNDHLAAAHTLLQRLLGEYRAAPTRPQEDDTI